MTSLVDSDIEDLVEEITPGPGLYTFTMKFGHYIDRTSWHDHIWPIYATSLAAACPQLLNLLFELKVYPLRIADEPVAFVYKNFTWTFMPKIDLMRVLSSAYAKANMSSLS